MKIEEFKEKYPAYKDVDNNKLADAIHNKFYKDKVSYSDFRGRIGLSPEVISSEPEQGFWGKAKDFAGDIKDTVTGKPEPGVGPISEKDIEAFEPDSSLELSKEVKDAFKEAGATIQQIGKVYPVLEGVTSFLSNVWLGAPASGLTGLGMKAAGVDDEKTLGVMQKIQNTLGYTPQTKEGKAFTETTEYPFHKLNEAASITGEYVLDETDSPAMATLAHTLIEGSPLLFGLGRTGARATKAGIKGTSRGIKNGWNEFLKTDKGKQFQEWNKAQKVKLPERMGKDLTEVMRKNPELSEAEIARISKKNLGRYFDEMRESRGIGEISRKPTTEPVSETTAPVPGKPGEIPPKRPAQPQKPTQVTERPTEAVEPTKRLTAPPETVAPEKQFISELVRQELDERGIAPEQPERLPAPEKPTDWNSLTVAQRNEATEKAGWVNKKGDLTPTGKKIARSDWDSLSSAAQNVIQREVFGEKPAEPAKVKEPWEMLPKEFIREAPNPRLEAEENYLLKLELLASQFDFFGTIGRSRGAPSVREWIERKRTQKSQYDKTGRRKTQKTGTQDLQELLKNNPDASRPVKQFLKTALEYFKQDRKNFGLTIDDLPVKKHKKIVQQALSEGKLVPEEVLAEYPDLKPAEKPEAPVKEKVKPSTIDTPAQGNLNAAREGKKTAWKRVKDLRERIKNEPIGGKKQELRLELNKAEFKHREYLQAEQEAKATIEKRANELGKTTQKQEPEEIKVKIGEVEVEPTAPEETTVSTNIPEQEAEALSPKEQKRYFEKELNTAIENVDPNIKEADADTVTIEVPGDGEFHITNTKESLQKMKSRLKKWPVKAEPAKKPGYKKPPVPQRITKSKQTSGIYKTEKDIIEVEYYNKFKPRKQGKIIEGNKKLVWKDGFYSNSDYMVKLPEKPSFTKSGAKNVYTGDDAPNIIETLNRLSKNAKPAKLMGETVGPETDPGMVYAHATSEAGDFLYNTKYIDNVLTKHPKAKPYMNEGVLVFRDKGKPIGAVSPIEVPEGSFPNSYQAKRIEEIYGSEKQAAKSETGEEYASLVKRASVEDIKKKWSDQVKNLSVFENEDSITLSNIIIPKDQRGKGIGSQIMGDLINYADQTQKRIKASPGLKDDRQGTTSRGRLVKFYKNFGFIENKGKNKDFTISEGMYREPKQKTGKKEYMSPGRPGVEQPQAHPSKGWEPKETFQPIPEGQRRSSLLKEASEKINAPIRVGKFRKARGQLTAAGIYKQKPEVIRLAKANDIETAIHEIGHHIEKLLGFPKKMPKQIRDMAYPGAKSLSREGFAEFLRYYVTAPEVAKKGAPDFYRQFESALESQPEVQDIILKAKNAWKVWESSPSVSRVHSFIRKGGESKGALPTMEEVYTHVKDSLYPLQQAIKIAEKKGHTFKYSENPYIMARLTRGWARKAEQFIKYRPFQYDARTGVQFKGKSLRSILEPIEKTGDMELFDTYLIAKRAVNDPRILEGFEGILSKEDFQQTIKELEPKFKDAAEDLYEYSNELLDFLTDSGRISPEMGQTIKEENLFYVPFYRIMDWEAPMGGLSSRNFSEVTNPIKRLRGSSRDIYSPTESFLYNTYVTINAAERNRVGNALMRLADKKGMGEIIEQIPPPMKPVKMTIEEAMKSLTKDMEPVEKQAWEETLDSWSDEILKEMAVTFRPNYTPKPNEALFYKDGKPVLFEISPDLAKAIGNIDAADVGLLTRIVSFPAKTLRAGATTFSPEFAIRNPIRDQMVAFIQSKYGYTPAYDLVRGLYHMTNHTELWQKFNASGAAHSAIVSIDRDYLSKNLKKMFEEGNIKGYAKNPLKASQTLSEFGEEGTRVGEFAKAIQQEGESYEAMLKAGMAGREISLDFARQGTATARALNLISAFWNARLEGLDKIARTFKERPKRASIKAFLGVTLPSVLLWYAQKDDPYYQELPTWRKVLFWNITQHNEDGTLKRVISIPKPFEYGIIFGSIPEAALDWAYTKDPSLMEETVKTGRESLNIIPMPTAAIGPLEWYANRSLFFDRPIVPRGKEDLDPVLQYKGYTAETTKLVARIMDKVPGLREVANPAKIENLIRGYTGGLGRIGLESGDFLIEGLGIVDTPPEPKMKIGDLPMFRAFISRFPSSSSRSIETFYKKYTEMNRQWESSKERIGIRGTGTTIASPPKLKAYRKTAKALSTLRKMASTIYEAEDVSREEKRESLDNIYIAMINVARAALEKESLKTKGTINGLYSEAN